MERTDEQLVGAFLGGEPVAFQKLVERHLKAAYTIAWRYAKDRDCAEDITQDSFVKAWKALPKFDQNKKFAPWFYQIVKNTALDFLKKKQTLPLPSSDCLDELEQFSDPRQLPEVYLAEQQLEERYAAESGKLLAPYAEVVALKLEGGATFREIAERTGEPLNTVKSRYRRALAQLRKLLA